MTATVKGAPVRNTHLQSREQHNSQNKWATHNKIPTRVWLCINLQGNTGSNTPTARVAFQDHPKNKIQDSADAAKTAITKAELHSYWLPASSNAVTKRMVADNNSSVPTTSTLPSSAFGNLCRIVRDGFEDPPRP